MDTNDTPVLSGFLNACLKFGLNWSVSNSRELREMFLPCYSGRKSRVVPPEEGLFKLYTFLIV